MGRSTILLVAVVLVLLVSAFLESFPMAQTLLALGFTIAILAAIHGTSTRPWVFRLTTAVAILGFVLELAHALEPSPVLFVARFLSTVAVLCVVAVVLCLDTLRRPEITVEQVSGALAAYLFIGLILGHLFFVLEALQPGAIAFGSSAPSAESHLGDCIYFSFVTLTTLGYGDIAPVSAQAR